MNKEPIIETDRLILRPITLNDAEACFSWNSDGDRDSLVKTPFGWKPQVFKESLGEDVLGAEQEVLPLLYDVRHVVVGAVSPVPDVDVAGFRDGGHAIHHGAEGTKLILPMDRLEQCVHIQVAVNIKQAVHMDAVEAFHRMAFGYEVAIRGKPGCAVKRGGGAISGKAAVARGSAAGRLHHANEGSVEAIKHFLNGFRPEFRPLLAEGG